MRLSSAVAIQPIFPRIKTICLVLKRLGSQADVVALFQMSQTATESRLPIDGLQLLESQNVIIYFITPQWTGRETFYRTQLDKFRILGLQQYEKVLFLDGDIMPLCNLDPFLSWRQFQENVVIEGPKESLQRGIRFVKNRISRRNSTDH
jgi:alpha-N-acetylglucosamine transferase